MLNLLFKNRVGRLVELNRFNKCFTLELLAYKAISYSTKKLENEHGSASILKKEDNGLNSNESNSNSKLIELKDEPSINNKTTGRLRNKPNINKSQPSLKGLSGLPPLSLSPIPHQQIINYAADLFEKPATFIASVDHIPKETDDSYNNFVWPNKNLPEIAFLGVSNAGKSTLINSLLNTKKLAKTSRKPGHTKTLNLFQVGGRITLVDMPGYGYKSRQEWGELVESYLKYSTSERGNLKRLFLLIESKRNLKHYDKMILDLLESLNVPYQVIVTKADKLDPSKWSDDFLKPQVAPLARYLVENGQSIRDKSILFVAPLQAKFGLPQLRSKIAEICDILPNRLHQFIDFKKEIDNLPKASELKIPSKKLRREFNENSKSLEKETL